MCFIKITNNYNVLYEWLVYHLWQAQVRHTIQKYARYGTQNKLDNYRKTEGGFTWLATVTCGKR